MMKLNNLDLPQTPSEQKTKTKQNKHRKQTAKLELKTYPERSQKAQSSLQTK